MKKFLAKLFLLVLIFHLSVSHVLAVTPTNLLSEDLYDWYNAIVAVTPNTSYSGVWVMEPLGDNLYLGLSAGVPTHDNDGPVFAYFDGTNLNNITEMTQQDICRMSSSGDKIYLPDYDPDSSWNAEELYVYDPDTTTLTEKRYRYSSYQFVDATTTDADGHYQFTGLKPTAYRIRFVRPADYAFSTSFVNSTSPHFNVDSNADASGYDTMCATNTEHARLAFFGEYYDDTEDAGLHSSPGTSAGTPTSGTRNETFFTGEYSIGDLVWNDLDSDGIQDDGEPGMEGVRVELFTQDPYFPCGVHSAGFWTNADNSEMYFSFQLHYMPAGTSDYTGTFEGIVASNAIAKSTDGGQEWEIVYQDMDYQVGDGGANTIYWVGDLFYYNGYWYSTGFGGYTLSMDGAPEGYTYWAGYYRTKLLYSNNGTDWSYTNVISSNLAGITGPYDLGSTLLYLYTYSYPLHVHDNLVGFRGKMTALAQNGSQVYRFNGGDYDIVNATGASLGDILNSFNDPDYVSVGGDSVIGSSQRYNSVTVTSDGNYLYALGDDNKIYATANLRNWIEVADFTSVDTGKPIISIEYWPNQDKVVVATAGDGGSLYGITHTDVVDQHFTQISNNTNLSFYDGYEPEIDLETVGGVLTQDTLVKKDSLLLSKISTTFSGTSLDWTSVRGDSNLNDARAYITNLTTAPGTASTHTLYVPIPTNNTYDRVLVCPNATSMDEVNTGCSGGVIFDGADTKTVGSDTVTAHKIFNSGQEYWELTGVSGTGAMALLQGQSYSPLAAASTPQCTADIGDKAPYIKDIYKNDTESVRVLFEKASEPVQYYVVEYGPAEDQLLWSVTNIADRDAESFIIGGLTADATYYFRLRSQNECATGEWSDIKSFYLSDKQTILSTLTGNDQSHDNNPVTKLKDQVSDQVETTTAAIKQATDSAKQLINEATASAKKQFIQAAKDPLMVLFALSLLGLLIIWWFWVRGKDKPVKL